MNTLDSIQAAAKAGQLMPPASDNLAAFLGARLPAWAQASIEELVARQAWPELNDRFYRYLEFGTGGMRGRTIGTVTAAPETGRLSALGSPEHAAIGSNMLNDFTLIRAVMGLFRYTAKYRAARGAAGEAAARHRARRAALLAAFLRAGRVDLGAAGRRGVHLRRPALHAAAQLQRALAQGPRGRGSSRPATIRPTTTASRPTSTTARRSCRRTTRASSRRSTRCRSANSPVFLRPAWRG